MTRFFGKSALVLAGIGLWGLCGCIETTEKSAALTRELDLVLAGEGATNAVRIVVSESGMETPKQAAIELQRLVEKATGAKWPVAHPSADDPFEGFEVVVGPHPLAEAAGLRAEELPPEGFRMRLEGRRLFLVGKDTPGNPWDLHWMRACQTGTLSAVVEFARRFLDARWVMPGPDGEVVARLTRLEVPAALDVQGQPFFRSRRFSMGGTPAEIRWMRFNRLGWSQVTCFWHSWYQTISPEVYGKEHPEWFALVNGVRQVHLREQGMGGQLCTSNPEVIQKMAEIAVENFRKHPKWTMFSLTENDGGDHCECPNCRALDQEEWHPGKPSLSDRFAVFANRVQEAIGDRAPGMLLGYDAYHQGELPPVKTFPARGIAIADVHNGYDKRFYQPALRAHHLEIIKGWREKGSAVVLTSYYHGMPWWSLPIFSPDALADLIQTSAEYPSSMGIYLGMTFQPPAFGTQGNEYVLGAELMWNPKQKASDVIRDYNRAAFGPAAKEVGEYFDLIARAHASVARGLKLAEDEMIREDWVIPTYEPIRTQADALLKQAGKRTASADAATRRRVQMAVDGWEWTKIELETLQGLRRYKTDSSKENARAMLEILRRREAFCAAHSGPEDYTVSVPEIRASDLSYRHSVGTGEYEARVAGEVRAVRVPLFSKDLDAGKDLEKTPWNQACEIGPMVRTDNGDAYPVDTKVRLLADAHRLYLRFDAREPRMERLVSTIAKHDGEVWNDDAIEIFLNPGKSRKKTYHLLVNPMGTVTDLLHVGDKPDASWESGAVVAARCSAQGWEVRLAIPYASLGLKGAPLPGDVWSANFTRGHRSGQPPAYLAWSPTFGLFYKPERFGDLVFESTGEPEEARP
ncbi:MAG: DUF4838 domain-containing protein [Verrucomicrobiae bacterium]|nr:DUF4838 domain-containing protein [Verrucomicrobiae bacterium]